MNYKKKSTVKILRFFSIQYQNTPIFSETNQILFVATLKPALDFIVRRIYDSLLISVNLSESQ